jgi:ADP-ribose pyrophosphatase YjhB (NUDIX family)
LAVAQPTARASLNFPTLTATMTDSANRDIRFQGAIVQDDRILILRYQPSEDLPFWLIPGGGREQGETESECVAREMHEETNLIVHVERQILEVAAPEGDTYRLLRTYLCYPLAGTASPGYEPETEAADVGEITEVRWLQLHGEQDWPEDLRQDPIGYPQFREIRRILGYLIAEDQAGDDTR